MLYKSERIKFEKRELKCNKIGSHLEAALGKARISTIPKPVHPTSISVKRDKSSKVKELVSSRTINNVTFADSAIKENIKPLGYSKIPVRISKEDVHTALRTSKNKAQAKENDMNALKNQFATRKEVPVKMEQKNENRIGSHLASVRSRGLKSRSTSVPREARNSNCRVYAGCSLPLQQPSAQPFINVIKSEPKTPSLLSLPLSTSRPRNLFKRILSAFKQDYHYVPTLDWHENYPFVTKNCDNLLLTMPTMSQVLSNEEDEIFAHSTQPRPFAEKAMTLTVKEKLRHLDDIRGPTNSRIFQEQLSRELRTKKSMRVSSIYPERSFKFETPRNWSAVGQDVMVDNTSPLKTRVYDDIEIGVQREFGI